MEMSRDEVAQLVEMVWDATLGLGLTVGGSPPTANALTGTVTILAACPVRVVLVCEAALARLAAAAMFGISPDGATADQMSDAVGELTNVIAGNIKGVFPAPCKLGLPTVLEISDGPAAPLPEGAMFFRSAGLPMAVAVSEA